MTSLFADLESRRSRLGMSKADLARRAKVSLPTVQRLLAGKEKHPGLDTVARIAAALGVEVRLAEACSVHELCDVPTFRERQARAKARRLVRLLQGTMALEAEAVDEADLAAMEEESVHALLAGPARRLWASEVAGWGAVEGESPIDPSGLRNRGAIRNRRELAAAEARGIHRAMVKYLAARPSRRSAPFTFEWFLKLHREMFGEVWTWAGILRTHDLNLGVTHALIREQLAALVADLHSWTGFGHALEDQAVWLHHRAVSIHPFENGNGRWSRLLANIWLRRHERPIILWPDRLLGPTSAVRGDYIDAMRAGDHGNFGPLGRFHDRFRETKD